MTPRQETPRWLGDAVRDELARRCAMRTDEIGEETLLRALRQAAAEAGSGSIEEYVVSLRADNAGANDQLMHLVRKITIGETTFFRHPEDLAWLSREVLPALIAARRAEGRRLLRVWSAGCATGEEAWTLAATVLEALPTGESFEVQVLGTDINDVSLAAAERAEYGPWSFRGVEEERRDRWFDRVTKDSWTPVEALRRCVSFAHLNLRDPIYPSIFTRTTELEPIVCRNVFIYFFANRAAEVLERFAACLRPDGVLLCGPSDLLHLRSRPGALRSERGMPHRLRLGTPEVSRSIAPRPAVKKVVVPRPERAPVAPARTSSAPPSAELDTDRLAQSLKSGRYEEACDLARAGLAKDPLNIQLTRILALGLSGAGRAKESAEAWKRVLYLDPTDPGAHLGLGLLAASQEKESETARRHFRAVVRLLEGVDDAAVLAGPDALPVGWVRETCRSLSGKEA